MTVEVFAWCSSRDVFVQGMSTTYLPSGEPLATVDEAGNLIPAQSVLIDEIGQVTDANGATVGGHHVNLVATGELANMLTVGLPQTDEAGNPLSVFQRTRILGLIPGLEWSPLPSEGVPPGYEGPNGVVLFDPLAVNSRSRVWL